MKNYKSAQFMHDNSSDDDQFDIFCPCCGSELKYMSIFGGGYEYCRKCGWEQDDEQ